MDMNDEFLSWALVGGKEKEFTMSNELHCKPDDQKKLDHWPIPNFEKDDGSKNSNWSKMRLFLMQCSNSYSS